MSFLSVSGISKHFGGLAANRDISFDVGQGELVGVIGPNGAGKSTLFEMISGFYRPDAGEVRLDGARLTGLSPDRVCRLGVARTFQKLRPFSGMTVLDNVDGRRAYARPRTCGTRARRRGDPRQVGLGERRTATRARSPPASASGSSWRARSRRSRGSCSSTRSPAASTSAHSGAVRLVQESTRAA